MVKAALVCLAVTGCSWTARDVTLGVASSAALAADWYQTRDIVTQCDELNPIIGNCGENVSPDIYFPVTMVLNIVVAHLLGPDWRPVALGAVLGAEAATVWANEATEPRIVR